MVVVEAFGFTLDEVNWLGNVVNITYLPCAALVPAVYARLGVRRTVSGFCVVFLVLFCGFFCFDLSCEDGVGLRRGTTVQYLGDSAMQGAERPCTGYRAYRTLCRSLC